MHQDFDAGMFFPEHGDVRGAKHLVNAAVTLPEDHLAAGEYRFVVAAQVVGERIPHGHLLFRDAHPQRRIASQVLVGEKHHSARAGERPFERRPGVARRADDPAVSPDERLQARGRVDVGDRGDVVGVEHFGELVPGVFDLLNRRHIGHRTTGGHIGQDDANSFAIALGELFRSIGQDVGGLGHKVDTAKSDLPTLGAIGRHLAELIAITPQVGQDDHLVLLIMVPQDQQLRAQRGTHVANTSRQGIIL